MKFRSCAIGVVLLLATTARAAEDGGTVSPLALGAGNQALALGGAFTAIADDASGWMWNPAGMGLVSRAEFQVSQTTYGDLGSSELYAGYVQPSWRWGALATSYRQFGTGGIEARDDRNVLIPGELTDRESELALGYGRSLSPGWSAGVVAKARRHELAGRSANAVGADLGVTLRPGEAFGSDRSWWRDVSVGVALRNVIRPALRLDVDEVPDPRGARVGLAWRRGVFSGLPATAALDVETVEGRSARLHAGLQMTAHPSLDLRVGWNGAHLTAGTALRVRSLTLDYAFEDGPIAPVHRAGLSMRFGMTVDEGRAQAQRQREDELQARLAEVYESRLRARVDEIAARAAEAQRAGDYDAALQEIATLRALAPDDPRASSLETQCLLAQARASETHNDLAGAVVLFGRALTLSPRDTVAAAGLERCRAASDTRAARTADLRRRFSTALDAFANGDLDAARRGLREILRQSPGDAEAGAMLARVQRAVDHQVSNLLEQAEGFLGAGLVDDAARAFASARALEPTDPGVERMADALARARQQAQARPVTPRPEPGARRLAPTPGLSAQERRDIENLYQRGIAALQQGRTAEAMRYFELVWSKDPGHARVAEYLKNEYRTRGLEAFAAGRLRDAVGLWEQALRVDPTDDRTRAYLLRAQEHLARTNAIGSN